MAAHATNQGASNERLVLGANARSVSVGAAVVAVAGLVVALILGWMSDTSLRRFFFAYLTAFAFCLSIVLGSLIIVLLNHLAAAGWNVSVRRINESIAALMPAVAVLAIPIVATVIVQRGTIYPWALPLSAASPETIHAAAMGETVEEAEGGENAASAPKAAGLHLDSVTVQKRRWMNPWFWTLRVVLYFAIWSWISVWYRNQSLLQDKTADPNLTRKMQKMAGICVVIVGLTLTGAAGDFLMSLDPHWFSTIFGVYYFAGSFLSAWATLIVSVYLFQRAGYLRRSIGIEHYHDLGKYLFGFTFFYGYIAFSQYMLLWYANIPEEVEWYSRHGATTVPQNMTGWTCVILGVLFGQILIPFAGLMSRHVKRRIGVLVCWAVWVLAFHFLDIFWMVMPEYARAGYGVTFHPWTIVIDIAATLGLGGVLVAVFIRSLADHSLRPTADPRLAESLAFQNI